jgi:hypothetical protein
VSLKLLYRKLGKNQDYQYNRACVSGLWTGTTLWIRPMGVAIEDILRLTSLKKA